MGIVADEIEHMYGGDFRNMQRSLRESAGSVTKAAKAAGVDRRTWQRWATGSKPKAATAARLREALAARVISFSELHTTGTIGGRSMTLRPGTDRLVRDAYFKGGADEAELVLLMGIRDGWYRAYVSGDAGEDNESIGVPDSVSFS